MGCLLQLIKTETDSECLQSTMEAIGSLVCADDDDFAEGKSRFSRFLEEVLMEHIDMKNSLESELQIYSLCSMRNPSRNQDIVKKLQY